MQLKRSKREYKETWLQTAGLVVGLLFSLLAAFGVITPADSAGATPIVGTLLGAVSTGIIAVIQLIGILFKKSVPILPIAKEMPKKK